MIDVFEKAKKYYPKLWDKNRIDSLYKANKLTDDEYNQVIKSDNSPSKEEE